MSKRVVNDLWGVRWAVRARRDRFVVHESEYTRQNREPTLRAHVVPALEPQPVSTPPLPWATLAERRFDTSHLIAVLLGGLAFATSSPFAAVRAIWRASRILNEPTDCFWVVELVAAGRIRRGATWRVADRTSADLVAAGVADAVRTGQVPEPEGAQLIDVVDERLTVYGAVR